MKRILREEGLSAMIVEQHAQKILGVTDHAVILERGTVVHAAPSAALKDDPSALEHYLGVTVRKAVPAGAVAASAPRSAS